MAESYRRLRELDFLRGLAILLVLLRHRYLFQFTQNMGWIGVDLFFVLSGFLVSGLLFREYLKFGGIKPVNFLIRRGFKIYPIYYLSLIFYLSPFVRQTPIIRNHAIGDFIFLQNYIGGWGYAYAASWSLAVEEHFYFGLAIILFICIRKNLIRLQVSEDFKGVSHFEKTIGAIFIICLILRVIENIFYPTHFQKNFTMTHLRVDSLLAGVLVSYLFHFRFNHFKNLFYRYKYQLLTLSVILPLFSLFIDDANESFFVKTIGFSLLYVSFSIILSYFLLNENINLRLDKVFGKRIVNIVSGIGLWSYSIYIIHTFVNDTLDKFKIQNFYLLFVLSCAGSIFIGFLMTRFLERYFLQFRNRYFPGRAG